MKALGLAMCKGVNRGRPDQNFTALCHRSAMCPSCERVKSGRRAHGIARRIDAFDEETDGDFECGVLTLTLPGKRHESQIRFADLPSQYEYLTARETLPGLPGYHSMRGVNRLLSDLGAEGGTHFLEWTHKGSWWNCHTHSLFWSHDKLDRLKDSSRTTYPEDVSDSDFLLGKKSVGHRSCKALEKLGLGRIYSLDYADDHEKESQIRYAAKVAYSTKPFVAPISKKFEIADFLSGQLSKSPRLARPFGTAQQAIQGSRQQHPDHVSANHPSCSMLEWQTEFPKNFRYLWQRS